MHNSRLIFFSSQHNHFDVDNYCTDLPNLLIILILSQSQIAIQNRASNKFKFTFNWFGFNAQIWFYLFKKFKLFNKKINILEIGTFEGMSTAYFLRYLKKSNLDAVDKLDKKSIHFKNFLFNKKKLKKFRYFNILSNKFFKKNKKKNYDLIYIDGSHYYKDVLNDALNSYKILNKDGIIIFDDLLYTRESRNKKNKEFTNTLGGIIIFLSKIKNYKIIYSGHQFVIQKK